MQAGFWRKCRTGVRWSCRAALVAVVALICAFVWFDRVGVPGFLQRRLVASLRERGVELEFDRLRFNVFRGFIARNVRVGQADQAGFGTQEFSAQDVRLELDNSAALRGRLQLAGLVLNQGRIVLKLSPTNTLALDDIQTELHFGKNDMWSLNNFKADFAGGKLALSGDILHAPEFRRWDIFRGTKTGGALAIQDQLKKLSDTLGEIHFNGVPQLKINFSGDARDFHSLHVYLAADAAGVQTPWADAQDIQFTARLTTPVDAPANSDPAWAWWGNLQPFRIFWTARIAQLKSAQFSADQIACGGFWLAPVLALTNLSARLGGGPLESHVSLNVASRELTFTNVARFDPHALAALLTGKTRERFSEFSWTEPPSLQVGGAVILPSWTNRHPDWHGEVQPTLRLRGELAFADAVMNGVSIDSAAATFSYSNLVWQIPVLSVAQARTRLEVSGVEDDATKDFHCRVRGAFDPEFLRPFLVDSNAVRSFRQFVFTEPVQLEADVWGRLNDYDRIGAAGRVALTNFTVRGQSADSVTTAFAYTNRLLIMFNPRLWRGTQTLTADRITLDYNRNLICFKKGYSTADPESVARAIGPKTGKLLEPYHFLEPPTVLVEGCAPLHGVKGSKESEAADLRFDIVAGTPFRCLNLQAGVITGSVHWLGETLILTNVAAELYGGTGNGSANFDFRVPHEGSDFRFTALITNLDLHALAADLSPATNHLEGALSGQLVVTHGDSRDWRRLDGFGRARLRDGLIWDIPLFGLLSPVLNGISPGLGDSRATDATSAFTITDGVINSDAMEINTHMTRLLYSGTVDLHENVNARVTAQLLHNVWGVGPLISTIFYPVTKLFEYKVTGTLRNPKKEPVYVPKILLYPLHPIRTIEKLLPAGDNFSSPTNAPTGQGAGPQEDSQNGQLMPTEK